MNFQNSAKFPAKRSLTALFIRVIDFAVRPFHFVKFEPESPGRNLEQRSMPGSLLLVKGGSSATGEVAVEHEQGRAHSPVASARPKVERGAPATCVGGLGRAALR